MKSLLVLLACVGLTACSSAKLQTEWKDQRGYSEADSALIMDQAKEYNRLMIQAKMSSNAFNSAPYTDSQNRLRAIFCSCAKKLGDKCRAKPEGLSPAEKALWVKANAVDMALVSNHTALDGPEYKIDPAECGI